MSAPSLESVTSTSSSGHTDGLGRRELCFDRETGAMLERLHVRPELAAFGVAVREQVERLATFEDARFARTCSTDRDAESGDLTVVSEFVPGIRLTDLLETARDEALVPGVDAALGYLLEALDAIGALHASAGCAHGLIAPDRTVFTPDGHLVFLDPAYAAVVERLGLSRRRLWIEFGIAAAPAASPARLDQAGDLSQAALSAVMLILGRALEDSDYPDNLPSLLMEVVEIAQIRGSAAFAGGLQKVFQRLLPLPGRRPYTTAEEALADLRQVLRREIGVEVCRAGLIEFVRQFNPSQLDAVPGLHEEALAQDEDVDDAALDESDDHTIDRPADKSPGDAVIEFELDLDPLAEPRLTRGAAADEDEVFELGSYDLNQDLGQFATTRPIITPRREPPPIPAAPLSHDPAPSTEYAVDTRPPIGAAPLQEREPEIDPAILDVAAASPAASDSITPAIPFADPPFAAAAFAGHDAMAQTEPQDAHSSPEAAAGAEVPQHDEGATDWEATLFSAQPAAILAETGGTSAEPLVPGEARQSAQAVEPIGADATVEDRSPSFDITPSADAAAPTAMAPAPAVDHAMEPAATDAHEAPSAPIARAEAVAEPAVDHVSPAPAPEPMSAKGGRRKRQQQKSARARKDKLRSTAAAKPEIVAPASTPPPALPPAQPPAASSSKSGWLIPPEKTAKFEGNAPELMASPFQSPAAQMPPPAPTPPPPQPVVSYQPPVTPLPAAPVFPALPAQGSPLPRFGTLGTPRVPPVQPAPAAAQPPSAGPVAFESVARLTPLKVKAEPPAGYTPAGHNRRGGRDVRMPLEPVAHLPYGPGLRGSEAAAGSRGFPMKLTIAAVVIVAAAILVGRSYLPGGVLGKPAADAAVATLPAADPDPAPTAASPAGTGQIVVNTEPAGARILLDGKPAGESPQTLSAIAAGKHVVTLVSSSGSVKRTVKVVAGRAVTLDVPVFSGWVTVFAPFVVEIAEDGKSLGTTEHGKLMIAPGRHHLVITNADLAFSAEQDVEVTAGDVSSVRLDPKGQASFNAIPWAEVWSDGRKIGDTPIANYELPLGSHEFVFKHPQFGERKVTATIRAAQPAAVATDFTKQP